MPITAELLDEKLGVLREQKDQHFAIYHQAIGAIGVLEYLSSVLAETPKEEPPVEGGE